MKLQLCATLTAMLGPILIAFMVQHLLSCQSDQAKTNEETLNELLAEIDRGEWVDAKKLKDDRPSEEEIAKGVEKAILDVLMKEYGFRFEVRELKVFHIWDDKYRAFLHTNKVSLHHTMYTFWFDSNGAYFFIENWTESHLDYNEEEL